MSERCDKYPSLERRFCSHCQGTARGTEENPHFSIKEDFINGCPVVELLKNGGSIHQFDKHFRFGLRKAAVVLAALPLLKKFAWGSDTERYSFPTQVIPVREIGITVKVYVEMKPDFVRSTGDLIEQPWLWLAALPPANERTRIGLGVMKCKAICAVQDDLRAWVSRYRQ